MTIATMENRPGERNPGILLMSGACLVGQNIYACLAPHRNSLRLVASSSDAREPTLFDFDAAYLTPPTCSTDAFRRRFEEIIGLEHPNLIIPCRDEDVLVLAQIRERSAPSEWGRFLCGNVDTAAAILDKMKSSLFCVEHTLPFAATIAMDSPLDQLRAFAEQHGFPLLAKPREGFASRGVFLILNHEQLARSIRHRAHLLQEYLGDPAPVFDYHNEVASEGVPLFHTLERLKHSIQVLISPDGAVGQALVTSNKMVFGKSECVALEDAPDIQALGLSCAKSFAQSGWRGPLNIQCETKPDGRVVIYEFNGRFTGATAARQLLGHDEVGIALRSFAGISIEPPKPQDGVTEVVRLPTSRLKETEKIAQLEQEGFWAATPQSGKGVR